MMWSTLMSLVGGNLESTTMFKELWRLRHELPPGLQPPPDGNIPSATLNILVPLLSDHTEVPDVCWAAFWNGWGFWRMRESELREPRHVPRTWQRRAREVADQARQAPQVTSRTRSYFLFRGPANALDPSDESTGWQSPSLFWPDDRRWVVSNDVDSHSTYIACAIELASRLTSRKDLDALEVSIADDYDSGDLANGGLTGTPDLG